MTGNEKTESDPGRDSGVTADNEAEAEAEELERLERGEQSSYSGFFPGEGHLHEMDGL